MTSTEPCRILVVNPGSTSTKMAVYEEDRLLCSHVLRHDVAALKKFGGIWDQYEFRLHQMREWTHASVQQLSAVVGIGGLFRPIPGGTYRVTARMLDDARANLQGEHASNLGCAIAHAIAREYGCEAYVVDPVSVDELQPLARYSGHPLIQRSSLSHALNIHAAARRAVEELKIPLSSSSLLIAHLGGGISVAPVRGGRIIDINDANSDGPFSPERTGGLPLQQFITLCFSGTYTAQGVRKLVSGNGGLLAYLAPIPRWRWKGASVAGMALHAGVRSDGYQIAKEISAMASSRNVHAVVYRWIGVVIRQWAG
jgi:butyrate kinase